MMRLYPILAVALFALVACTSEETLDINAPELGNAPPPKTSFRVAWSRYPGWEPWGYAQRSGILKRWADQEGIRVEMVYVDSYIDSIERYARGEFDGCAMTNIDALTIPVAAGVDSTVLIIGDYSFGNDGLIMQGATSVGDLRGRDVLLVPLSVSHYLLDRATQIHGVEASAYRLIDTSENAIFDGLLARPNAAAVTWKPHLDEAAALPEAAVLFDSADILGEVLDLMVIRSDSPPALRRALVGAWYEALAPLTSSDPETRTRALTAMARDAGMTAEDYDKQLETTAMFYFPWDSAGYARSGALKDAMQLAVDFAVRSNVLAAPGAGSEAIGVLLADGEVIGNQQNIKLRFDIEPTRLLSLDLPD